MVPRLEEMSSPKRNLIGRAKGREKSSFGVQMHVIS